MKIQIEIHRVSTLVVEAPSLTEAEAFVKQIRESDLVRTQVRAVLDMTHREVKTSIVEMTPSTTPRWTLVGDNLSHVPIVAESKDALARISGDFFEDRAVTLSDRRLWVFFPSLRVKTTLVKMAMEKRLVHSETGQVGKEFSARYMVENDKGTWVDQEYITQTSASKKPGSGIINGSG